MKQNQLIPVLVVVAATIVGYVLYVKVTAPTAPVASGAPLGAVPQPGVDRASGAKSGGGIFARSALPPTRSADADNSAETLATVATSNKELRQAVQKVLDDNEALKRQNAELRNSDDAIAARVRNQLQAEMASKASTSTPAGNPVSGLVDTGITAATQMINGIGAQPAPTSAGLPAGLGYDGAPAPAPANSGALTKVIAPMGYRTSGSGEHGRVTLVRNALAPDRSAPNMTALAAPAATLPPTQPEAEPYYTIPENATLVRSTAMTTLVGRVPIDGRVQDPMQFKLVIGRENLAASGQYVPDDISGVIVSGIAVGDMALSCAEGLIQSLTFVFDDGTIRTVSQRTNGASANFGSSGGNASGGGVGGQSLAAANKLGWISDEFGNPCIPGQFVTNAPAYLADVIGAKTLSVAGAAVAAAETTTTHGVSALGSASSTTVTGDKGSYVLGKAASAGSDEIVNWLMRRLNNSFDAVVVRAGTHVAVHIDQAIHIDKEPDGRRLDYARGRTSLAPQQGTRHGTD